MKCWLNISKTHRPRGGVDHLEIKCLGYRGRPPPTMQHCIMTFLQPSNSVVSHIRNSAVDFINKANKKIQLLITNRGFPISLRTSTYILPSPPNDDSKMLTTMFAKITVE